MLLFFYSLEVLVNNSSKLFLVFWLRFGFCPADLQAALFS